MKSEIRESVIKRLSEKSSSGNYGKYLKRVILKKLRSFSDETISFDFPVTAIVGPNGGGKTTVMSSCPLLYRKVAPRQFFARNRQFDQEMKNWLINYEAIDREVNKKDTIKRSASFSKSKWYRDALNRDVLYFGVSRTLPAVERKDLLHFTSAWLVLDDKKIHPISDLDASYISRILGKDVTGYSMAIEPSASGEIALLAGKTASGSSFSEFHFGAGESSIIKIVIGIEKLGTNALILIEEIENGLHPVATQRLVDYLIDVADRKSAQIIFTTHSNHALNPLPSNAIWSCLNGSLHQGKLDIMSLRTLNGDIDKQLIIYTEDDFSSCWIGAMLRYKKDKVAHDAIGIYPMHGDGTAVKMHMNHKDDPSSHITSVCIIDGDSRQVDDIQKHIYRLPGESPESYVYDNIMDIIDNCSSILSVRLMQSSADASNVASKLKSIRLTNKDPHLLYNQVAENLGFLNEPTVRDAFLTTWCERYPDIVDKLLTHFEAIIPLNSNV